MNPPNNQPIPKYKLAVSLLSAAMLALVSTASADVLFTDNFTFPSNPGGSQNMNVDINTGRQGGLLGTNLYLLNHTHHQAGNTGTDVGQPVISDGNYVLVAVNGDFQSSINIASASTTTLTVQFDMYQKTSSSTDWAGFSLRNCDTGNNSGPSFPIAGGNEFGFLHRKNGGVQVFQNGGTGGASGQSGWDTAGFAPSPHWKLVFTDTAGTGSAFVGNGSKVAFYNNNVLLGTITLSQNLRSSDLFMGWQCTASSTHAGIDNLEVDGTRGPVQVTTDTQQGANPFTPSYTAETPNLLAGASPSTANGNFSNEGSGGASVLTDGTIGTSGTIGGFATCGGASALNCGNTLIYALPNGGNGVDVTNIVTYSGWGDAGRFGQYYQVSYSTVAAPTTFLPITTVCFISGGRTGNGGLQGAPTSRVTITGTNGTLLASGAANIKFDFSTPPNSGSFNNGYQGYSEIIVQGTNTSAPPPPPSGYLTQDTLPGYAETVVGDQVVFSASYSNFPPVTLQWQRISGGTTNNVSTTVVNVTNNDNVTSTLTLNNVQTTDSGFYQLKADNATNGAAASSYSTGRHLVVGSTPAAINNVIVNYAAQSYPASSGYVAPWVVDSADLNLIAGFTAGSGQGTFVQVGNFTGDGTACSGDASVVVDGLTAPITSVPNYAYVGGGTLISGAGQSLTYTLVTNSAPYGLDITNITVFGGWQDTGRDEQKFQVLYATFQSPTTFVPLLTADYVPGEPDNNPVVSRTTLVPASGVMAHNVAALKINFNVSPQPKNGWEGYSEILVGGTPTAGVVPIFTDISPNTASDMVGGQIILSSVFTNYTSLKWVKNGTNVAGATSLNLILNNVQLTDAGSYTCVASNAIGTTLSSSVAVTVVTNSASTNNIITAIATQTSVDEVFTPTWNTNVLGANLLYAATLNSGDGDFTGGSFGATPTGGSAPTVLTDGTFGTIDFNLSSTHSWVTCIGSGTGVGNAQGGNFVTYTLPVTGSGNGYDITNIMTAGGWNDGGRDQQSYTVRYATAANPTYFQPLAVVSYNPSSPVGYSMNRATLTPVSGVLAANVVALQFDMTWPAGENGFSGYSEIAAYGSPSATAQPAAPLITAQHEEFTDAFTLETPNLIAGQLPSSFGAGVFSNEGCSEAGLTDGILSFGGNTNSASCGDDGTAVPYIIFNSASGWNLTNIVTYSLWHDYGRDGQFYNVSYSTLSNPTTFVPLASVAYNPSVPHDGRASGNRIGITPALGQTALASNVFAVKFDFTPQGTVDFGWSGYTEIVLQGDSLTPPAPPVLNPVTVDGSGNLILTGTGVANYAYEVVTTTNLTTPLTNWTVSVTGATSVTGVLSNAIPISATNPASFFRVRMP